MKLPANLRKLWLALLLIGSGGSCLIGGVLLALLGVLAPDEVGIRLPETATSLPPVTPTPGFLLLTPLAPPDTEIDILQVAIMPLMAVASPTPPRVSSPQSPSLTFPATSSPSPTSTPTRTPTSSLTAVPSITRTLLPISVPTLSPSPTSTPTLRPSPTLTPSPTPTPQPRLIPDRISIPSIGLDAPVVAVAWSEVEIDAVTYHRWDVPDRFASGWHNTSAGLGERNNLVLNGHHNVAGQVFGDLIALEVGATLMLYAKTTAFKYIVVQTMLLPESDQPVEIRLDNARWLLPSADERVTLVTCWPPDGNSHRLLVIALPEAQARRQAQRTESSLPGGQGLEEEE